MHTIAIIMSIFRIEILIRHFQLGNFSLRFVVGKSWPDGYAIKLSQVIGIVVGDGEAPIDQNTTFWIEFSNGCGH